MKRKKEKNNKKRLDNLKFYGIIKVEIKGRLKKVIKKYKNGKIRIQVPEKHLFYRYINDDVTEGFYYVAMFWEHLRIEKIEDKYYLIDLSTNKVYDVFSDLCKNPLQDLLNILTRNKVVYLKPAENYSKLFKQYIEERIG